MAEGILKTIAKEKGLNILSSSAGVFARDGEPANRHAISSVEAIGIDIRKHISRNLTIAMIEDNDLILTMTKSHKDSLVKDNPEKRYKIFTLNEYAFGKDVDINDPYGGDRFQYDMARDEILRAIKKIYDHI